MTKEDWKKRLALYDELISNTPEIERKGKTMPYTSENTYMFSLLNKDGEIGIRLSKELRQEYAGELGEEIYKSYGAVMKDYVLVPEAVLENPEKFSFYLRKSRDYVNSLEPQPRKK